MLVIHFHHPLLVYHVKTLKVGVGGMGQQGQAPEVVLVAPGCSFPFPYLSACLLSVVFLVSYLKRMVNGTHQSVPTAQSFLRSFPFLQLDGDSHAPSALTLLAASVPGLVLLPPVRALCPTVHRLPFLLHLAPSPPAYLWIRPLLLALDFVFLNKQPNQGGEGLNFCTPPNPYRFSLLENGV